MLVAVTMRVVDAVDYHEPRDAISHELVRWVLARGHTPLLVPNCDDAPARLLAELRPQALLLSGGNDLVASGSRTASPARDRTETELMAAAVERRLPVFGICRGLQMINRYFGGGVSALPVGEAGGGCPHAGTRHSVRLAPALRVLAGVERVEVNSFHGYGVRRADLAPALAAVAWGESDGVVEALVHAELPIAALQWHPERAGSPAALDARLFSRVLVDGAFWRSMP